MHGCCPGAPARPQRLALCVLFLMPSVLCVCPSPPVATPNSRRRAARAHQLTPHPISLPLLSVTPSHPPSQEKSKAPKEKSSKAPSDLRTLDEVRQEQQPRGLQRLAAALQQNKSLALGAVVLLAAGGYVLHQQGVFAAMAAALESAAAAAARLWAVAANLVRCGCGVGMGSGGGWWIDRCLACFASAVWNPPRRPAVHAMLFACPCRCAPCRHACSKLPLPHIQPCLSSCVCVCVCVCVCSIHPCPPFPSHPQQAAAAAHPRQREGPAGDDLAAAGVRGHGAPHLQDPRRLPRAGIPGGLDGPGTWDDLRWGLLDGRL